MNNKEKVIFLEEIIFGIDNGEGLDKILESIIQYLPNRSGKTRRKFQIVLDRINHGVKLSLALFDEKIISKSECDFLAIGEDIGELRLYLSELIDSIQSRAELIRKLINSLIYPSMIFGIGLFLVTFLCVYIFPKISRIFTSLKIDLPITTKVLLAFSNYINQNLLLCISLMFLCLILIALIISIKRLRLIVFNLIQKIIILTPYINGVYISYWTNYIYSNLAIIVNLNSNYFGFIDTMISSLPKILRHEYTGITARLNRGANLAELLACSKYLPPKYAGVLEISSKSGNLAKTLNNIANDLRKEYMNRLTVLLSILEPLIIIFLGILVVIIALSVILPIYKVTGNMNLK